MLHTRADPLQLWGYYPSLPVNVLFAILFGVMTATHIFMRWQLGRTANFMIPLLIGSVFETIGYITGAAASNAASSIGVYAIQNLLLLLAPVLFAASCYMTLSRVIRVTEAEQHSKISLRWLTKTFVISDVVCFWIQGGGGSIQVVNATFANIGKWVVVVGLIIQVLIFGFYIWCTVDIHRKLRSCPTAKVLQVAMPWERTLHILYVQSALIVVRNIFRVAEYADGRTGWLMTHEVMLFVFDAAPMTLLLVAVAIWNPARLLKDFMVSTQIKAGSDVELVPSEDVSAGKRW